MRFNTGIPGAPVSWKLIGSQKQLTPKPVRRDEALVEKKTVMKSILMLEDESEVMELQRGILKGYNLIEALTAEEALRLFRLHSQSLTGCREV